MGNPRLFLLLALVFGMATTKCAGAIVVELPPGYDPEQVYPVIIYAHGAGQTASTVFNDPLSHDFFEALRSQGYILVGGDMHGNSWGDHAAMKSYRRMYRYVASHYSVGPVILGGQSMGGLTVLQTVAKHGIPGVRAAFLICPVCDLDSMWQDGSGLYASQIDAAYQVDARVENFPLKAVRHNPADIAGAEFAGVPMWVCASPADAVVPYSTNTGALVQKLSPFTTIQYFPTTGDHSDPSNFSPVALDDLSAMLARIVK